MNAPPEEGAWLEAADGTRHPIKGSCSLGRTGANTIVLESPKVSRRHALIHLQNIGELWLIDFGSSNGTFLNKRRIHHPIRLSDGDQITIGDQVFKFRQPARHFRAVQNGRDATNIAGNREGPVLASRRGHSRLYASQPPCCRARTWMFFSVAWIFSCNEIIENQHGMINKYLGDGFLAYWPDAATSPEEIAAVISAFKELQRKQWPEFRFVVHFGRRRDWRGCLDGRRKLDGQRSKFDLSPGKTG